MYWFGAAASLFLQVFLIIHVFRNGKDRFWLYIIFFVPVAGSIAYIALEIVPDLRHSRAANRTSQVITRIVSPNGQLRQLEAQLAACNTVTNKVALALALTEANNFPRAIELLTDARQGIYQDDPKVLSALTKAYYRSQQFDQAISIYREIIKANPSAMSATDYLHLAIAQYLTGHNPEAEENFRTAMGKSGSFEIKYEYATMLTKTGNPTAGKQLLQEIVNLSRAIPRHAARQEQRWIKAASEDLAKL